MSSKASGSPEEECQSSHPDRFPKGFLEEVAAQLDFEVLELAWGMRSEGAGALGSSLGLRSAQDPHTVGLTWLCWVYLELLPRLRGQDAWGVAVRERQGLCLGDRWPGF